MEKKRRIINIETDFLRNNASMNEIKVKLIFLDKENIMKCMSNVSITHNIQFKKNEILVDMFE